MGSGLLPGPVLLALPGPVPWFLFREGPSGRPAPSPAAPSRCPQLAETSTADRVPAARRGHGRGAGPLSGGKAGRARGREALQGQAQPLSVFLLALQQSAKLKASVAAAPGTDAPLVKDLLPQPRHH